MAEIAFGTLAVPGTLRSIWKIGKFTLDRIEAFRKAPQYLQELKQFGYDIHKEQLREEFEVVAFLLNETSDPTLISISKSHITRLESSLEEAQRILEKVIDRTGNVNRLYFSSGGEKKLKEVSRRISTWQLEFSTFIALIDIKRRTRPLERLLSWQTFQTITNADSTNCTPMNGAPHISLARAEFKTANKSQEISVMIECPSLRDFGDSEPSETSDLVTVAEYLAHRLISSNATAGMLPCLGYRVKPHVELIFQIPPGLGRPQSLNDVVTATAMSRSHADEQFRIQRQQLARQLSEAVYSVHNAQLVHKNIRPETIVVLDSVVENVNVKEDDLKLGLPFLTNWNLLRDKEDPSSRTGDDDWLRDIYRHPERQGLQLERRYNINHDIYSLGVCLLVIGLWEPLISREDGTARLCKLYTKTAFRLDLVDPGASNLSDILKKPAMVRQVLLGLTEQELTLRMNKDFVGVVEFCLKCLEKRNIAGEIDRQGTRPMPITGQDFKKQVIDRLSTFTGVL